MDKTKKNWYSKPLKVFWDDFYGKQKGFTPNLSDSNIFNILRNNLLKAPLMPGENTESRELLISGLELWNLDAKGKFLHIFFLDRELRNFLEKMSLSDLEGIRTYLFDNGEKKDLVYLKTKEMVKCVHYNFGLHIPFESDGYAFSLNLFENNSIELYFSHGKQNGRFSNEFYKAYDKKSGEKSIRFCNMFRLAINTIAYMKCFPECVTDGVPKISYPNNEDRSRNNLIFKLSDKITDIKKGQRSKMPHFRKGYFKLLQSDFYKNKQGQIIFIPETMVKGKAKTVSTSTQLEKLESDTK